MDGLTGWLASVSWPIVSRVLAALGFGTVTYTGMNAAVTAYLGQMKGLFGGLASEVLNLFAMAGGFEVLSITSGGIVSGMAFMVLKKFALQTTGPA